MEYGSIEREIHIDASPEVVFDVVTQPEHIREWWEADSNVAPTAGATGELVWALGDNPRNHVVPVTVVASEPHRLFSFRWTHPADEAAVPGNSLLVTFELLPAGEGTVLKLSETGFREMGWEAAVLEEQYNDHVAGWNVFVPNIAAHATQLVSKP